MHLKVVNQMHTTFFLFILLTNQSNIMSNVRFYQFFNFGGFFGVIRHTFADIVSINIFTLITLLALVGVLAAILPLFFTLFYALLVLLDPPQWEGKSAERNLLSIFTILACAYFIADYHYGWLAWIVVVNFFGPEFADTLCYTHTTILLLNVFLVFFGHVIFMHSGNGLMRLAVFIGMCWFSNKHINWVSEKIISSHISQFKPEPGKYPIFDEKYYNRVNAENSLP
jgi:hypothetical protein